MKKWMSFLVGGEAAVVVVVVVLVVGGEDEEGLTGWVLTLLAVDASDDEDGRVAIDDEREGAFEGAGMRLALPSSMKVRKVR